MFPICGYNGHQHLCGCEKDEDCPPDYICDGDNGCVEDVGCDNIDANCDGFNATCNIPAHDNCFYCDGKECLPGCGGSDDNINCPVTHPVCGHGGGAHLCGCDSDADCDSSRPICTEHACHAPPGKVLIDSIKVYTASCDGCSPAAEGVKVELVGETNGASPTGVVCNSNAMDHAGSTDFGSGSAEFNGRINGQEDQAEKNMMGGCYEGPLNAQINGGWISWEGEGTWQPEPSQGVCVDWRDKDSFVFACDLSPYASGTQWDLVNCNKVGTDPYYDTSCP